ncbi:MAG: ABC transporter permease [Hyphomicrobiaceae bacterium]
MIFTLALRNLIHDRIRFLVTLVGVVFSIVLVSIQFGLYKGTESKILSVLDHTSADLWIMARDAPAFDDAALLDGREEYAALSVEGVKSIETILAMFGQWKRPTGGRVTVVMVGVHTNKDVIRPWNVIEGRVADLKLPESVIVDRAYADKLGVSKLGDTAQVQGKKVRVVALTNGIRSFTTLPIVFVSMDELRALHNLPTDRATFVQVNVKPGINVETVKAALIARLPDADILTNAEFRDRSVNHWMFGTGAGAALIMGAVLGLIVGMVIVAQTLYASANDHINEFATLRALGSSAGYIHKVILWQAVLSAIIGFVIAIILAYIVAAATTETSLRILISPQMAALIFGITVVMCVVSALSAIVKVTRIDPAMVFNR